MDAMVINALTKYYGKSRGVIDLNLTVAHGEVFGFIGPNGAGKSTTIRMLMQLIYPTSGTMTVLGTPVAGEVPELRRRIGYLPSEVNYYQSLTGRQMLEFAARAYGVGDLSTINGYAEHLDLNLNRTVRSYSLGNRKKLAIIQSLIHDPELLILDEPTSGLDPLIQSRFFEILREKNAAGMTIFLSTHVLSEVERFCHRVGFIREGRLIQVSTVEEIPGRAQKLIEVRFVEPGDLIAGRNLRQIDPNVTYSDGVHVFHAEHQIHQVLHKISEYPIEDITVRTRTLEELFMEFYEKREEVR